MKKNKNTATAETNDTNLNTQLAKPGKPGELTVLEQLNTVLIPRRPRFDHLEAYRRFKGHRAGLAMLSAGKRVTKHLLTEGISKDEEEKHFLDKGMLVIGTGGGEFGNPDKESRLESKGIKMGEKLGLKLTTSVRKMNQTLKRLLEQDGGPTELPAIFRTLPHVVKRDLIPDIYCYTVDAIQDGDIARLSNQDTTQGLQWYYDAWKKKEAPAKGYTEEKVLLALDQLIAESIARRRNSHIELSYAVQCIFMKDREPKASATQDAKDVEKEKLIFNLISALYLNDVLCLQAVELCKAAERHRVIMTHKGPKDELVETERNAVFIIDANPNIARASHHESVPKIDILVVQNPHTKNYGIYINKDLPKCHRPEAFWRMVQALELIEIGWDTRDIADIWKELLRWKQHEALEGIWSCFMRDGRIDNGLFKEDFRPSSISPEEILNAIQHAFNFRFIGKWMREHRIFVAKNAARQAAQPTSGVNPAEEAPEERLLRAIFGENTNDADKGATIDATSPTPAADAKANAKGNKPKPPKKAKGSKKSEKTPKLDAATKGAKAGKDLAAAFAAAEKSQENSTQAG